MRIAEGTDWDGLSNTKDRGFGPDYIPRTDTKLALSAKQWRQASRGPLTDATQRQILTATH